MINAILFISMEPSSDMYERVQLYFNGRNLRDLDFFSKSDPKLVLFFQQNPSSILKEVGRTEIVPNNVNPDWKKSFQLTYIFEARQQVKIEVYDDDGSEEQLIGRAFTNLGALVGARNQTTILTLKTLHEKEAGKVIVRVEKVQQSGTALCMKWRGVKLMNTDSFFDFWDKSDPYLKFIKIRQDGTFLTVATTEVIKESLQPNWNPISIPITKLISPNQPRFKVQCWDQEQNPSKHHFIGETYVTIDQFKNKVMPAEIPLSNPKKNKPGKLLLEQFQLMKLPTFVDYLRGGLQLNLIVAIDFTGSNGIPTSPSSLHYMNPNKPNEYQLALQGIWQILQNYDSDKRIPAFGFGAKPRFPGFSQNIVNHCFPLSGRPGEVQIVGFNNLLQVYNFCVSHVEFAGPTHFSPLIEEALHVCTVCKNQGSNAYQVLLILTDGEIHDMDTTINLIVNSAAVLPLSIIIVGVGSADFSNMNKLDGDSGLYNTQGVKCPRDIVQFVPFRDYGGNPASLAQQLLRELPNQVVQYMKLIGKMPNNPIQIDVNKLVAPKILNQNVFGNIIKQ